MTFKSTWVKAYLDDDDDDQLPGQVLSDAAVRNNDVDSLANAYLSRQINPRPEIMHAAHVDAQGYQHIYSRNQDHGPV